MREFLARFAPPSPATPPPDEPPDDTVGDTAGEPASAPPGLRLADLAPLLAVDGLADDSPLVLLFAELIDLVRGQTDTSDPPALLAAELAEPAITVAKQVLVESDRLTAESHDRAERIAAARSAVADDPDARRADAVARLVAVAREGILDAPQRFAAAGGLPPF